MVTFVYVGSETIPLSQRGGLEVISSAVVTVDHGLEGGSYELTIEYDSILRRLVATRVAVERASEGTEVTSRLVREVTIQEVVNEVALTELIRYRSWDDDGPSGQWTGKQLLEAIRPARGRPRVEVLEDARLIMQVAHLANLPHLVTIAKCLDVSHSTAKRLIGEGSEAREAQNG
ncbi:hypothetical protein [Leucobacter sp. 7(1)]|uniref:hypothetical protein n=1 Tax=Leucobacter sp. 7(1) TaxID=1255613 RepID=UPI000B35FEED|nr:hypothetical protein [Leucobacter sp. 7(1)]